METKISDKVNIQTFDTTEKQYRKLWFYDGFTDQGDLDCTLKLTGLSREDTHFKNDTSDDLYIELDFKSLIRLKHSIDSHFGQVKEWRENHKIEHLNK